MNFVYSVLHCNNISEIPSNVLLMILSKQLEDYHNFLVGYLGYTMEEVTNSMYLNLDHKTCVLKMLSLWRCKDGQDGVKTVGQLLSVLKDVLQRGPYQTLKNVIDSKCDLSCGMLTKKKVCIHDHFSETGEIEYLILHGGDIFFVLKKQYLIICLPSYCT